MLKKGCDAVVELLIKRNATIKDNHASIARLLLAHKADPCLKNKEGSLSVELAFAFNHFEMVTLLTNAMADAGKGDLLKVF